MPAKKSGFSLLEISIALVIIGLVAGGIVIGNGLITGAQINKTIQMLGQMNAAANIYKEQHNYWPGDNPKDIPLDALGNKNWGDGRIDTGQDFWPSAGTHYLGGNRQFFYHISGRVFTPNTASYYNGSSPSRGPDFVSTGQFQTTYAAPMAKGGKNVGFWISCTVSGVHNCTNDKENYFSIVQVERQADGGGAWAAPISPNIGGGTVRPVDAYSFDLKIDDGIADEGKVMSGGNPGATYGAPSRLFDNPLCDNGDGTYRNDTTAYNCTPIIRFTRQ